ncbi:MAG TPA: arsenic resistance N-acetyltransferase ArsN2 [Gemmatimonadaceae bacterium]|nr:arsenic resistance N-acetyltransferase ArsN2 [Gemmatimonadaceae bacterium]
MTRFRRATPDDWRAVAELLTATGLPLDGVEAHLADFVVAENSAIVGCAGLERYGSAALLRSVAVSAPLRGIGIGAALVNECIVAARAAGITTLVLLTETAETFFATLGFARIPRAAVPDAVQESEEFRGACPASATAMRLDLSIAPAPMRNLVE